ncbi:PEP-CTERM sorting domain-containing protein (plasmid) [Roseomonas marmotae]|uniref:PEP-CTERM sorting domain-containing protein n=1 Tax=Roseomonas marmotae TaxID=2768161 RepID=A0ABS3KHX1_9PROT|nr:PEP-CTERM sorting domain-containing protein [Roseomonas marmotae]QTI82019.1 PEP-CTERM sorting domain-containing protein [Roseomonas marmotae]
MVSVFAFALQCTAASAASILFVGNSFTYGDPAGAAPPTVQAYRPGTVTDLNGTGIGGVPALFKAFTLQAGLDYDVSLETQGGSGLDFHWNNRRSLIDQPWDHVVLQSYSTLDVTDPGNPAKLIEYSALFADLLTARNPDVDISLMATWSRADQTYRPTGAWYGQPISAMYQDVQAGYEAAKANSPEIDRVITVGGAWNRAMETGFADPNPYDGIAPGQVSLWAPDNYHASVFGYYLEALMVFGSITGLDPLSLGLEEYVAADLGITPEQALALQRIAHDQLAVPVPEPSALLLLAPALLALVWSRRRGSPALAA